ncbi:unnamed protein product [Mytilus coruscus]|uniref:Integrase core domain-containing protein n=1 Tax=Mytilus coruscus TaxID=42192 RepID=A0A6J8AWN0_MYTCO|nr:unnamed protein product [Mytilus coruscus]
MDMEGHGYIGALINNQQAHTILDRDQFAALYYLAGNIIREIIGFLTVCHGVAISERQLHRILRRLNLVRRHNESPLEDIITAIQAGSGRNTGYRLMQRRMLDTGVNASLETVRVALTVLDADGVHARGRHVLRRRQYLNQGPNFAIHMDGWDKLKPFGISIHAAIDGYSRRLLWLKACSSNKNPQYIAHFYLNYIREINGVPCLIYADRGTENVIVRDLQYALRWHHRDSFEGLSSFVDGSSNRNMRIERFWRNLRSMCGQSWIDVFKGMADYGILDTSDMIHLECVRYCFMPLINVDLQNTLRYWNEHRVRRSRT